MDSLWCKQTLEVEHPARSPVVPFHSMRDVPLRAGFSTSKTFSSYVLKQGIRLSMDGKGRCIDNVFIERFWWSVKYEDVYIKEYKNGKELNKGLDKYFKKYNNRRRHQSLADDFPRNLYFPSQTSQILCEEVLEEKYLYLITA